MKLLLLIPFLLAACTAEESTSDSGPAAVQPGYLEGENGEDRLAEAANAQSGSGTPQVQPAQGAGQQPLVPAGQGAGPYQPRREPQFHFESDKISDEQLADYYVEMSLQVAGKDVGTMTFVFWPEKAPRAVRNFLRYCDEGFYDGLVFHRILRDFMIQGGSPDNTGAGQGPHGNIPAEFSREHRYDHRYGVLSMARGQSPDSASSQFFIICGESPPTVNLNGGYSTFGKMVYGVQTLEAAASVPVGYSPMNPREKSAPQQQVVITKAVVKEGTPPQTEEVVRPLAEGETEARRVIVQHILISMAGVERVNSTRTAEEAKALAYELLERAKNGEDFGELVKEYSDDHSSTLTDPPGRYKILDAGGFDYESMCKGIELQMQAAERSTVYEEKVMKGELTMQDAREQLMAEFSEQIKALQEIQWMERNGGLVPGFGDMAFSLAVGEIGIVDFDPAKSPFGWHIIKRIQ